MNMVTLDLNANLQLNDLFSKVQAGEPPRVVRGDQEVMVLVATRTPTEEEEMELWSQASIRDLAKTFPPNEFADWNPPDGAR